MVKADDILNAKILIVDDQQGSMHLLEQGLRSAGYTNVTSTMDPTEVCLLHWKNNYDLILLDLVLPGLSGFEVIWGIKDIEGIMSLPVLVVTAVPIPKLSALKIGVKNYVSKPFELTEVLDRIKNMVEVRLLYTEAKNYTIKLEKALKEVEDSHNLIQVLNSVLQLKTKMVDLEHKEHESYNNYVSHDLRSPLRFVNRIAHMMLNDPDAPLPEKATKQLSMIVQATDEMGQMIERLLNFEQSSRVPLKIRRVDLKKLFQEIIKEQKNGAVGHDVEIEVQEMEPCQGDQTLLKEVVSNLLENAFKYKRQSEGGKITVGCTEKKGRHVYFVKDNGVGFDMKELDSLFLPFKRLHHEEDFKGTGIGLALVKRIIERHGGRIWAEGKIGKGATFYFTLGEAMADEPDIKDALHQQLDFFTIHPK